MIFRKSLPFVFAGFVLCLAPLTFPSCTHDPVGIELLDTVCFDPTIMGILQSTCGGNGTIKCHDGSIEGFSIYDTASIMGLVNAGDPRGSTLYQVITDVNGENFMPPDHPISKEYRTLIEVWIAQGALRNKCGPAPVDTGGGNLKNCNDSVYFEQKILPLITTRCVTCHDGLPHQDEDNLFKLITYQDIRINVDPTSPESSRIYQVLNQSGEDHMPPPPNEPLSASEKSMLLNWIKEGARNNSCSSGVCDTSGAVTYTARVDPIIQFYCMGCHSAPTAQNLYVDLSSYDKVRTVAQTLRPNSASGTSLLVGVINSMAGFKPMPKGMTLDQCSIRTIELWINQGMVQSP
jgi:hypothetical protein